MIISVAKEALKAVHIPTADLTPVAENETALLLSAYLTRDLPAPHWEIQGKKYPWLLPVDYAVAVFKDR